MNCLECLHQKVKFPLQFLVDLCSDLIAQVGFVLLVQLIVLNELSHELLNAIYNLVYLLVSLRMSHSNSSSKIVAPFSLVSLRLIGIMYSFASIGMSIEEKFSKIGAYLFSRVLYRI